MSARSPRSTVTFLFTDIEGSTRQWEESPEMFGRVETHFGVLRRAVDAGGGEVFATMGDGIAAAFGSVEAAVQAAVSAQARMPTTGLAVRMGIHTGEVERVDDDFRGRTVNRAARIMGAGKGGQILVSDVTAALLRSVQDSVELVDLGTHQLRGLADPERLWQLLDPELEGVAPAVRGIESHVNHLPGVRTSLVGRDADAAHVIELFEAFRIITLTGVGGVGKTRLALRVSADLLDRFANVWFVDLTGVSDPDDVASTIARTVGVAAPTDPVEEVAAMLLGQRTLLVVDNCEHVIEQAAAVIDELTARCPNIAVLATSREMLDVEGERVVAVQPLDPTTSAAELFYQRAAAAGADLDHRSEASVADLCRRLDGLPLAIELAAARTATLGLASIIDGLDDRLDILRAGRRRAGDRHGTIRATIEWSYRLLEPAEQQIFLSLAVFPGGAEFDAVDHLAAHLAIASTAATDHVTSLVHKSMLVAEPTEHGVRLRVLETLRAFAREQLDGAGRLSALTALATWMTAITDLPFDDPCSAEVERNASRLEREADNWREAMVLAARLGSADLAAALCGPPVAYFLLGRHDLADVVRPVLELCDQPAQRRAVLCALIVSASGGTAPAQLQRWAQEIQQIDESTEYTGLGSLMRWFALVWAGDFDASIRVCVEGSLDPRLRRATRDMLLGIAVLDRFSLTAATDDPDGLIERALEAADRSDVAMHRVTCLLGAAWGLAESAPDRSTDLVRRALRDIPDLPPLTRLTLPGSAARLLSRLDPRVAARGLLEQLDASASPRSFVDLIPLFYGANLLERFDHDSVGAALEDLTTEQVAPYLSMMDFVDLARRAAVSSTPGSLAELEAFVRSGLRALADGDTRRGHELERGVA